MIFICFFILFFFYLFAAKNLVHSQQTSTNIIIENCLQFIHPNTLIGFFVFWIVYYFYAAHINCWRLIWSLNQVEAHRLAAVFFIVFGFIFFFDAKPNCVYLVCVN